ncbi:RNA polymerase sigma factor [Actinomadura welshii]|uniref:RNA polymerase sigma factor n=1 Tax=Actinomadura welshii TaxID=3103817 RepID=UPI0009E07088|nr:sigma-70 family RNA polymerase sigma factor [Actinomadura madurae]
MSNQRSQARFEAFYRRNRSWTRVYMRRRLQGTEIDWEALWNDAWSDFSKKYLDPAVEFEKGPTSYLNTCFCNAASGALRKHLAEESVISLESYKGELPEQEPHVMPMGTTKGPEELEPSPGEWRDPALVSALARLSSRQRAIIEYWAWKQPPPTDQELAVEFNIGLSTAKTHKRRAIKRLRQMLELPNSETADVPPDAREEMK